MPAFASTRLDKGKSQGCARFLLAWIKLHANSSFGLSNATSHTHNDSNRKALDQNPHERTVPQQGSRCVQPESFSNFEIIFLPQLPVEVRLLIYTYVFYSQPASLYFNEMSFNFRSGLNLRTCFRSSQAQRGWAVLRTCRQTYWEGLDVAINSCSLQLKGPYCLDNMFSLSLRPQLITQIRYLEIDWVYCATSHDPTSKFYHITDTERTTWEHLWTVVALTTSLKHLAIRITYDGPREGMHAYASWLTPLRQLRGVKDLEVDIWHVKSLGTTICTLKKDLQRLMMGGNRQPYGTNISHASQGSE